jgi:hypothetical protein
VFVRHMSKLLEDQEEFVFTNWVKADAVKASNMKRSETVRYVATV